MMGEREKRILVVDDDDAIRALLFTVLRRRNFLVDTAPDGLSAIACLQRCVYSMMLLDLMMPRMNGWDVLDDLAQRPVAARPLVIVMTAGLEPRNFPPDLVTGTIRKPFDVGLLVDMVTASLGALPDHEQRQSCPDPESRHKGAN